MREAQKGGDRTLHYLDRLQRTLAIVVRVSPKRATRDNDRVRDESCYRETSFRKESFER